jgi:hypothetical protein
VPPAAPGGDSVTYEVDLGDSWEHTLLLEKVVVIDPMEDWLPWCLDGRRAAPPEDVGGTGGYTEFLEATGDPCHEDHAPLSGKLAARRPGWSFSRRFSASPAARNCMQITSSRGVSSRNCSSLTR